LLPPFLLLPSFFSLLSLTLITICILILNRKYYETQKLILNPLFFLCVTYSWHPFHGWWHSLWGEPHWTSFWPIWEVKLGGGCRMSLSLSVSLLGANVKHMWH
jgi:hypothetical protein